MPLGGNAGPRPPVDRHQTHQPHQAAHPLDVHETPFHSCFFVVNRPEDVGLLPDGETVAALKTSGSEEALQGMESRGAETAPDASDTEAGLTLKQALQTSAFYIIATGLFSLSMLVTSLHFFQVSIFESHGLSAQTAVRVFPVSALVMVLTIPLIGRMLDHFRTAWMFAAALVIMAVSLISATQVESFVTALVYAVVFGLNNVATITMFAFMWPRYFGLHYLGSIQGTGQMIGVLGASLGPIALGISQEIFGGYTPMLLALTAVPVCCAILALFLRDPDLRKFQPVQSTKSTI